MFLDLVPEKNQVLKQIIKSNKWDNALGKMVANTASFQISSSHFSKDQKPLTVNHFETISGLYTKPFATSSEQF